MIDEEPHRVSKGEKEDEFFLITSLVSRRLAYPVAVLFCRLGVSANAVTILGGVLWVASAVVMVASGWMLRQGPAPTGYALLLLSLAMVNVGYILDVADGSIARMTNTATTSGHFLDYVFHLIFHPMFFCSVGIFLHLAVGSVSYLILGVLSICAGWGVSFSAKEHVLCATIAKNDLDPSRLTDQQRYRIFVDSQTTRRSIAQKRGIEFYTSLAKELFLFPGQYTFISIVILVDLLLLHICHMHFVLLRISFVGIAGLSIVRVPFRVRREFQTMKIYDQIRTDDP